MFLHKERGLLGAEFNSISPKTRLAQKQLLQQSFVNFFSQQGLLQLPNVGLIAGDLDNTVDFIGSSTNIYKNYLIDREGQPKLDIPERGIFTYQPKFRAQNGNAFYNQEKISFSSYFTGGGILLPPNAGSETCNLVTNFLLSTGLEPEDILIKASSAHRDIVDYWQNNPFGIQLELDSEEPSEYQWEYGEAGLSGDGFMYAVKLGNGKNIDFSTVTIIRDQGANIGIEWGFGSETFLASWYGFDHPIAFSSMPQAYEHSLRSFDDIKMSDAFLGSLALLNAGISYQKKDQVRGRNTLIKYLKAFSFYARELGVDAQEVEGWIEIVNRSEFESKEGVVTDFMIFFNQVAEGEARFSYALTEAVRGNTLPLESFKGVKKAFREGTAVDIVSLGENYYNHLAKSALFQSIKSKLKQERFL